MTGGPGVLSLPQDNNLPLTKLTAHSEGPEHSRPFHANEYEEIPCERKTPSHASTRSIPSSPCVRRQKNAGDSDLRVPDAEQRQLYKGEALLLEPPGAALVPGLSGIHAFRGTETWGSGR